MKFKRFLIIFLCVALLAAFSVSCFATSQETYGFYISPGDYVFDDVLSGDLRVLDLSFDFTCDLGSYPGVFSRIRYDLDNDIAFYYFYDPTLQFLQVYTFGSQWASGAETIHILDGFYIYDIDIYQWWQSNVTRVSPGYNSSFFDNMLSIFTAIGQWISGAAANLTSMFFVDNSLTFVGTLCVAALSMAVAFLIIGLISRFLRFRA